MAMFNTQWYKRTFLLSLTLVSLLLLSLIYCLKQEVVSQKEGIVYYLKPNTTHHALISDLYEKNLLSQQWVFKIYLLLQHNHQLKAGEYLFPKGSNLVSIWRQITTGSGLYYRSFTIIPGWTFKQLRQELEKTIALRQSITKLSDQEIALRFGAKDDSLEGKFYPETYLYTRDVLDLVILKRAYDLMTSRLKEAWDNKANNLPYKTPYEALIAASIIEKEAYLDSERPLIASVIVNRLNKNMLLQCDPTVIFGLGDRYTGKLHKEDLLFESAYNTYLHKGLPPSPIAMPGGVSLQATLHPQSTDYLYFVANNDGSHKFSATLEEHNVAVNESIKQKVSFFNTSKIQHYLPITLFRH